MELSTVIFTIIVTIIWLNVCVYCVRTMNSIDNDAAEWDSLPLVVKIIVLLISPIAMLIFERHILYTYKGPKVEKK